MSLSAIAAAASTALPALNFHPHGHRKGAHADQGSTTSTSASSTSGSTSATSIGQLPVGAATPLFNNILQSLTQTLGSQVAAVTATAPAGAGTTAAAGTATATTNGSAAGTTGTAANVQAFMHSLFQALKQDGLGSSPSSGAASAAVSGTTAAAGAPYQANLVSSLQTLVQQVGQSGNAAASNLSAAYQNLVNGAGSGTAATSTASSGAASNQSAASLQNFLNNLLQNLQAGGVHSLSGIGNNVNANV